MTHGQHSTTASRMTCSQHSAIDSAEEMFSRRPLSQNVIDFFFLEWITWNFPRLFSLYESNSGAGTVVCKYHLNSVYSWLYFCIYRFVIFSFSYFGQRYKKLLLSSGIWIHRPFFSPLNLSGQTVMDATK